MKRRAAECGRRRARAGFTLIELLVVLAIMMILMSLLTPAVTGALGKAKASTCSSQVRQLLIARSTYAADSYGNLIPDRPPWPDDPRGWCTWRWFLKERYGVGPANFVCPAAPNAYSEAGRGEGFATAQSDVPANFAQIGEVFGNDTKSRREAQISAPSRQIELIETRDYWPDMNMGSWGWVWADGYGVYGYWHSLRTTAGYADGHVEIKKLGATATPECQWDTPAGPHDGATHGEYGYMLDHYK
jgi:prepilin-type N-terminal cleavage/methylation domain-containing protein/prepilin-type processing-associated H-X9-DG protein